MQLLAVVQAGALPAGQTPVVEHIRAWFPLFALLRLQQTSMPVHGIGVQANGISGDPASEEPPLLELLLLDPPLELLLLDDPPPELLLDDPPPELLLEPPLLELLLVDPPLELLLLDDPPPLDEPSPTPLLEPPLLELLPPGVAPLLLPELLPL